MSAPVIGRVEFAPYVVGADVLKREQERSAALLAAMRAIVRESDTACRGANMQAVGIGTLQAIRKMALDAIAAAK